MSGRMVPILLQVHVMRMYSYHYIMAYMNA